jgi:hypothetical protein
MMWSYVKLNHPFQIQNDDSKVYADEGILLWRPVWWHMTRLGVMHFMSYTGMHV